MANTQRRDMNQSELKKELEILKLCVPNNQMSIIKLVEQYLDIKCYPTMEEIADMLRPHINYIPDLKVVSTMVHNNIKLLQVKKLEEYNELIMAVGKKYPNETRHETALRYIRNAELSDSSASAVVCQHMGGK